MVPDTREGSGFRIVVHEPTREGLVRFLVFRTTAPDGPRPALIGSGTRDDSTSARAEAERMVARCAARA